MRKIVVKQPGGYEKLRIEEFPMPTPAGHEVLIESRACGTNFADCSVRMGVYSSAKKYVGWPITPGFEIAGVVTAVGDRITQYKVGDKVIALTRFGGYATHLTAPESCVVPLPANMTFTEGASFPAVFLTAYYALWELVHPKEGHAHLIHSAAGGVGSALMQLSKIAGCRAIGVVGASHKVETLKQLGFHEIIDKSKENLWGKAKELCPNGYQAVFDANGIETLQQSYNHLASEGKLVVYGFHTMFTKGRGTPNWLKMGWDYFRTPRFNPMQMTGDNHSVLAFNLSYLFDKIGYFTEALNQLLQWHETGLIRLPPITEFPLDQAYKAHAALESGMTVGKIVLLPD